MQAKKEYYGNEIIYAVPGGNPCTRGTFPLYTPYFHGLNRNLQQLPFPIYDARSYLKSSSPQRAGSYCLSQSTTLNNAPALYIYFLRNLAILLQPMPELTDEVPYHRSVYSTIDPRSAQGT